MQLSAAKGFHSAPLLRKTAELLWAPLHIALLTVLASLFQQKISTLAMEAQVCRIFSLQFSTNSKAALSVQLTKQSGIRSIFLKAVLSKRAII